MFENKRPFVVAMALAALLTLAGCGQSAQSAQVSSDAASQESAASSQEASAGGDASQQSDSFDAAVQDASQTVEQAQVDAGDVDIATTFPSWNEDSPALESLVSFVDEVTDESSEHFVPAEDRVATFDMDGTVICEKDPVYMDYSLLLYRVLEDPDHQADPQAVETCQAIRASADEGVVNSMGGMKDQLFASEFAGMTPTEFDDYVNNFLDTQEAQGFSGMTYGESFYYPMVEVMEYLAAYDFDVYMVSACTRDVVRAVVCDRLDIDPSHVIGSDLQVSATDQGGEEATNYTLSQEEDLEYTGAVVSDCAKMNKVIYIQREIGKEPILAFGNSTGDFAMLNYAASNDEYSGMGVLIVADDLEREYGDAEKAATMTDEASTQGWTAVSMRDDWATIYGDDVTKTQLPADAA